MLSLTFWLTAPNPFAVRSKTRRRVLIALEANKMPSQLKKELKLEDSNVARALRELQTSGLIRCVTGLVKMGRIYTLTKDGLDVRKKIVSMGL